MRVVFVHGIENQGRSEAIIRSDWLDALSRVLSIPDMAALRSADIVAPYYGDVLYSATQKESETGPEPVAQSVADAPAEEARFYLEALEDLAPVAGVTETQIRAQAGIEDPTELGLPHDRRLLAILRALEAVSPWQGRLILKFLPQAFVYLHRPHVKQAVDEIVQSVFGDVSIVVGHSLGSVVTYGLLREQLRTSVPFYLTLGSPLAVRAVKNAIGPPFERPSNVGFWLNGLDPDDAVTIGRGLKSTTFGGGIENIDDVDNGAEPHDIRMYLRDARIARAIVKSLDST